MNDYGSKFKVMIWRGYVKEKVSACDILAGIVDVAYTEN